MGAGKTHRLRPPFAFRIEALRACLRRWGGCLRRSYRRSWFYRRILNGHLCDSIVFSPHDPSPRQPDTLKALLTGTFPFAGKSVTPYPGVSVFDTDSPSPAWYAALHSFDWLPPLAASGRVDARALATRLIGEWVDRYDEYCEPVFSPEILARRLIRMFVCGRFVVISSELTWRSRLFVSLRGQVRLLARIAGEAPEGPPRIEAAVAVTLSGVCLNDNAALRRLESGLLLLKTELARQILADGGHVSRSPEALVETYRLVFMATEALSARGYEIPAFLSEAQDRMILAVSFFRLGDGRLAVFNGGTESNDRMIAWFLMHAETSVKPFVFAEQSGYLRLAAGHTQLLFECGRPPPPPFSAAAHAGTLGFEMSSGTRRIVVSCGDAGGDGTWGDVLRSTAAHSTIVMADTSDAALLPEGWLRRQLGARLYDGPHKVPARRRESARGWSAHARHDGYVKRFGVSVERELTLSPQGLALYGTDRIKPVRKMPCGAPFAIRFHIHPDVRLSQAQGGDVLLKLPNGEGWRFRAALPVEIEESVYSGGARMRRAEQLVLTGRVDREPVEVVWTFEQIGGV